LRVPHETIVGPRLIIGNDVENIGRFLSRYPKGSTKYTE